MEVIRPKVGVGVVIRKDGKVLLGKRKNAHGEWDWSFPGGPLEYKESVEECAKREVMEEIWITIKNIRMWGYTNDIFEKEGKHYITLFAISDYDEWDIQVLEPEECEKWEWFSWNNLPSPLFVSFGNLEKQKFNPFDPKRDE